MIRLGVRDDPPEAALLRETFTQTASKEKPCDPMYSRCL